MPDVLDGPQTEALVSEPKRMTAEEFAARHENDRVELIVGIVREKPMPNWEHGRVCVRISSRLDLFAEKKYGQVFSNDSFIRLRIPDRFGDTVYGPDVSFVSYERLPRGPLPRELSEIIPELVVEAKSPSDSWSYVFGKMATVFAEGFRSSSSWIRKLERGRCTGPTLSRRHSASTTSRRSPISSPDSRCVSAICSGSDRVGQK